MATSEDSKSREHRFRILSVSDDDGLRRSRDLLLANEGFEMESVTSNAALIVSRLRPFDAALICQSVEPDRAVVLCERLHRTNPEILVVRVASFERARQCDADLEIEPGPRALLDGFHALCGQRIPARSKVVGIARVH